MTDNEIIKALECCGNQMWSCTDKRCRAKTMGDALDLINRQKAEIEELTGNLKFVRGTAERQKATIERLRKYDEERDIRLHARLTEKARAEAIKGFAERIKAKFDEYGVEHSYYAIVDKVLEEMAGDDK